MDQRIIKGPAQLAEWIAERRQHDPDFDPDIIRLPALVVWIDGEANGYPDVTYTRFNAEELESIAERLQ
jgi:hypothetical protein